MTPRLSCSRDLAGAAAGPHRITVRIEVSFNGAAISPDQHRQIGRLAIGLSRPTQRLTQEDLMPVNDANVNEVFQYHAPRPEQVAHYESLRRAAHDFARAILANTPSCADQQAALRHVREAVMTANAAVALSGLI